MARRTQERHQGAEAAPQGSAEKERPFRWGLIVFAIVAVIAGGVVVYLLGSRTHPSPPLPSSQASSPPTAVPTQTLPSVGPAPATTYDAFAALPSPQQQTVMQQAIQHYLDVADEAFRTFDPTSLPQVATGRQLVVLQQSLQSAIQKQQPISYQDSPTLLHIVLSPRPYSFVSIEIQGNETGQYLDPKTLRPVGTPTTTAARSTYSFVIQDGVWKVSDHIQEPTS